jgi:hypothetical protein
MILYSTSGDLSAQPELSLESAVKSLIPHGFRIESRDTRSAKLTGPGIHSSRQPAVLGATAVSLSIDPDRNRLVLDARLGGIETMQRFLTWFPPLLGLSLGVVLGIAGGFLFGRQFGIGFGVPWAQGWAWMLVSIGMGLLPISPWLLLSPLMTRALRRRTEQALDTIVHSSRSGQ